MVKLPYASRDPLSFRRLARKLLAEGADCGYYRLDCSSWDSVHVRLLSVMVYDRLSGLRMRLRKPVIVFEGGGSECRVESVWDGEAFRLECEQLKKCCVTRGP